MEEKLASDGLVKLRAARIAWKATTIEDLRENVVEYQLIEVAKELGLVSKTQMKALHGMLNKRNECAHPSDFYPDINDTLGYISELQGQIDRAQRFYALAAEHPSDATVDLASSQHVKGQPMKTALAVTLLRAMPGAARTAAIRMSRTPATARSITHGTSQRPSRSR